MTIIRAADYDDGGEIVRLLGAAWTETSIPFPPPRRPDADWYVDEHIANGMAFVADAGAKGRSQIVGMALYDAVLPKWNGGEECVSIATNQFFVLPEHRAGSVADRLAAEGTRLAQERGVPFFFSVSFGGRIDEIGKWIELKGFTPAGGNFVLVP